MARQLIESLSGPWEPEKYHDEYRERVLELIEQKAEGKEIAVQPEEADTAPVPDLMAALEASIAAAKQDKPKPKKAPAKKKAAAKKKAKAKA